MTTILRLNDSTPTILRLYDSTPTILLFYYSTTLRQNISMLHFSSKKQKKLPKFKLNKLLKKCFTVCEMVEKIGES